MADIFRIVAFPNGDTTRKQQVLLDLSDGVNYYPTRDTLQLNPPGKRPVLGSKERRYGGSRQVGELHDNASFYREFLLKSAVSRDDALNAMERVVIQTEDYAGKFLEWRPDGASRSIFMELRGTATYSVKYSWAQFAQAGSWTGLFNFPTAPLARGDCMDLSEDWAQDTVAAGDYVFDAGTASNVQVQPVAGQLAAVANVAAETRMVHTARGYLFPDHQEVRQFALGTVLSGFKLGVLLKRLDANNYVEAYVTDNGTASTLKIDVISGGGRTNRASASLASRLFITGAANPPIYYWLWGRVEGGVVYAGVASAYGPPSPFNTQTAVLATATYQFAGAEQTQFGAGVAGRGGTSWVPQATNAVIALASSQPYTFWSSLSSPEDFPLRAIPGSATALADLSVASNGAAAAPVAAVLGWARRAAAHSRVWNGGFEAATAAGWSVAALSGYTAAATSITARAPTMAAKFGLAYGEIATPATNGAGGYFAIYRRFKRGVTYTFQLWLAQNTGTATQLGVKLGNQSGSDTSATVTATPGLGLNWVQVTGTWTPAADADVGILAVFTQAANAIAFDIDGVVVYEGTVAPAGLQGQGNGASPPYGVVPAEANDQGDVSGWTLQADGTYLGGYGIKAATSGQGTGYATWFLDPSLMPPDAFVLGELHVEVWARVELAATLVTPRLVVSALSEAGTSFGTERFSAEYGGLGKQLTKPASGSALCRPVKLGTVRLPTQNQGLRWKLKVTGSWGVGSSGNFGIDYLLLVPARQRAVSPTAKPNDLSYPRLMGSTQETVKTILSDLRGRTQKVPLPAGDDSGLGGSLIEIGGLPPAGQSAVDVQAIMALWPLAPDDPTVDNTSMAATLPATFHATVTPRYYVARGA